MVQLKTVCLLTEERVYAAAYDSRGGGAEPMVRGEQDCRLPDTLLAEHDPDQLAQAIQETLGSLGDTTHNISLVVPLQWCFTHVLGRPQKRTIPQALAYEFEEFLPVPVEELTCVFTALGDEHVLATAIPTAPMSNLLAALLERRIEVDHIVVDVAAILMAQETGAPAEGIAVIDAKRVRLATCLEANDRWVITSLAAHSDKLSTQELSEHVAQRCGAEDVGHGKWLILDLVGRVSQADTQGSTHKSGERDVHLTGPEAVDAITTAALATPPDLDLRTGALAPGNRWDAALRLVNQCLLCTIVLVLVVACSLYLEKQTLLEHLNTVEAAQQKVYQRVFDSEELPPGAAMRVASQRIRLEGLTHSRKTKGPASAQSDLTPMDVLRNVVDSLPPELRVMLLDARIDGRQLVIRGHTAQHRDAERIAESINRLAGLNCRPPRTTRLKARGVEFSLIATGIDSNGT